MDSPLRVAVCAALPWDLLDETTAHRRGWTSRRHSALLRAMVGVALHTYEEHTKAPGQTWPAFDSLQAAEENNCERLVNDWVIYQ